MKKIISLVAIVALTGCGTVDKETKEAAKELPVSQEKYSDEKIEMIAEVENIPVAEVEEKIERSENFYGSTNEAIIRKLQAQEAVKNAK